MRLTSGVVEDALAAAESLQTWADEAFRRVATDNIGVAVAHDPEVRQFEPAGRLVVAYTATGARDTHRCAESCPGQVVTVLPPPPGLGEAEFRQLVYVLGALARGDAVYTIIQDGRPDRVRGWAARAAWLWPHLDAAAALRVTPEPRDRELWVSRRPGTGPDLPLGSEDVAIQPLPHAAGCGESGWDHRGQRYSSWRCVLDCRHASLAHLSRPHLAGLGLAA